MTMSGSTSNASNADALPDHRQSGERIADKAPSAVRAGAPDTTPDEYRELWLATTRAVIALGRELRRQQAVVRHCCQLVAAQAEVVKQLRAEQALTNASLARAHAS